MRDVRLEDLKDVTYGKLKEALEANNLETSVRLAEIYVALCGATHPPLPPAVGFSA